MAIPFKAELLQLDVQTRLELIEELWESVRRDTNEGATLPLSDAERALLDERLREDDEDPDGAIPHEEAMKQLRDR